MAKAKTNAIAPPDELVNDRTNAGRALKLAESGIMATQAVRVEVERETSAITTGHVMIETIDEEETEEEIGTLTSGEATTDDDQSRTTMMIDNAAVGRCTWVEIHGKRAEGELLSIFTREINSN